MSIARATEMLKKQKEIFAKHGEEFIQGDCFGFFCEMTIPECRECCVNKKCGEIKKDIMNIRIPRSIR